MVKCFQWDTGNSMGEMVGHNKRVTSVCYKPTRPFRILTGSEDFKTICYQGPPFKLDHSNAVHSNFVNCVRYSPDGSKAVSVSSDKKIQFYDGATGNPTTEIAANTHAGTISSVAWSPDGTKIMTSSADKTVKVWNVATMECETTFTFGADPQLGDMQVSVLWTPTHMISVSLNGNINLLNLDAPGSPNVLQGHQVAITAACFDTSSGALYTGSFDGVINARLVDPSTAKTSAASRATGGDKKLLSGNIHTNKVVGMAALNNSLYSVGWDDKLRVASLAPGNVTDCRYIAETAMNGQPSGLCANSLGTVFVTTNKEISLFEGTEKKGELGSLSYSPLCCATNPSGSLLAVGGDDQKTHIYAVNGFSLERVTEIETRSAVTALSFHPVEDVLAIGDNGRQIELYDTTNWTAKLKGKWVFHTSRVTSLAWSADGMYLASGSLDENIYIWDYTTPSNKLHIPFAHNGGVSAVCWVGTHQNQFLASVGADHCVATWDRLKLKN